MDTFYDPDGNTKFEISIKMPTWISYWSMLKIRNEIEIVEKPGYVTACSFDLAVSFGL